MICLEEKALDAKTIIKEMHKAHRKLIHENADLQLDPVYAVLARRFYR